MCLYLGVSNRLGLSLFFLVIGVTLYILFFNMFVGDVFRLVFFFIYYILFIIWMDIWVVVFCFVIIMFIFVYKLKNGVGSLGEEFWFEFLLFLGEGMWIWCWVDCG